MKKTLLIIIFAVVAIFMFMNLNEENKTQAKKSIKFATGEEVYFENLKVNRIIDDESMEKETIFDGTDDFEKMEKIISELNSLEVADEGEELMCIPSKESLLIYLVIGENSDRIIMYDSEKYKPTGLYHYSYYGESKQNTDLGALLSKEDLISKILDIINE